MSQEGYFRIDYRNQLPFGVRALKLYERDGLWGDAEKILSSWQSEIGVLLAASLKLNASKLHYI